MLSLPPFPLRFTCCWVCLTCSYPPKLTGHVTSCICIEYHHISQNFHKIKWLSGAIIIIQPVKGWPSSLEGPPAMHIQIDITALVVLHFKWHLMTQGLSVTNVQVHVHRTYIVTALRRRCLWLTPFHTCCCCHLFVLALRAYRPNFVTHAQCG